MLQLIGIPLILAAWAIPALFALTLAFLFGLAVFRPLYLAWVRAWDATAARISHVAASLAEWVMSRAYVYVESHPRSHS
jgi:hypothetical protein